MQLQEVISVFQRMLLLYTIFLYMDLFVAEFLKLLLTMLFASTKINITSTIFTFIQEIT